jgi:hypothetical protein
VTLTAGLLVAWALRRAFGQRQPTLAGPTWACGFATPSPRMAYTASSFAAPLLGAFRSVAGVRTERTAHRFATHAIDPVLERVIVPAWRGARVAAGGCGRCTAGLSLYLVYVGRPPSWCWSPPHGRGPVTPAGWVALAMVGRRRRCGGHRGEDQVALTAAAAPGVRLYADLGSWSAGAVYSRTTTWVFRAAPVVVLASLFIAVLFLPLDGRSAPAGFAGDVVAFAGLLALARFALVLAGLDTGSSFEGMGASREVTIASFVEPALFLCFIALVLATDTVSLSGMLGTPLAAAWPRRAPR